jgi:hypothetical protein
VPDAAGTIGEYDEGAALAGSSILALKVKAGDIAAYWTKCGLIANFGSSYLSLNYPRYKNISNSISFIVNELLENAVKFSSSQDDIIRVRIACDHARVVVDVRNTIDSKQYAVFSLILEGIQDSGRANTQYLERFNSSSRGRMDSGIGLLSIINFFKSRIAAKFSRLANGPLFEAYVQAAINIENL